MRSIWKGTISFFLLSIPVKLYNAIETSENISFNQLHRGDCLGPIGYTKQCKKCDTVVTTDDIVKGYQHDTDKYVTVTPDDLASIKLKSNDSIEVIGFLPPDEIPSTYLDASYFLAPNGSAANKAYALLREVMKRTGLIAIGKVILRDREDLLTISPEADGLILQKLHYRHEVRTVDLIPGISPTETNSNELDLAETLVNDMRTSFADIDTVDRYHSALKGMLEKKIAGETIEIKPVHSATAPVVSIMDALQKSLSAKKTQSQTSQAKASNATTLTAVSNTRVKASTRKRKTA
jgi:DNA end-binding protein Ku